MSDLQTSGGYAGQQQYQTAGELQNAIDFVVRRIIAGKTSNALVQVLAVHGGGIAAAPTVDVQPLVDQLDGLGNRYPHGTVFSLPVFRLQAGTAAVICDPKVGDKGAAVICDRDISIVKSTGARSGPGSHRQNDWCDGLYFGSFLGGTPTEYVELTGNGINIVTPGKLTVSASNMSLDSNGNLTVKGDVTAGSGGGDSVTLQGHKHGTGTAAAGTIIPTAGT
jgi:hypothetical protein